GFRNALRVVTIRGAGNLLGSQQHGFIDSVGFDMYSKMLSEAIEHRKAGIQEEPEQKALEPELTLKIDAYIPDEYIADEKQKIEIYKEFQALATTADIQGLQDELMDCFGEYPVEVENLFTVSRLRMLAKQEKIEQIVEKPAQIDLIFDEAYSQQVDGASLFDIASEFGRGIQLGTVKNQLKVVYKWQRGREKTRYEVVEAFIQALEKITLLV